VIQTYFTFDPFDDLRQRGELLKLRGMQLSADKHDGDVAVGQSLFLLALLKSTTGVASIDDATADLSVPFADGGKWRGTVVRGLAVAGLIERVDVIRSDRPSRHRGLLTRWRLVDRDKAERWLEALAKRYGDATKNPQAAATAAGDGLTITQPEQQRNSSNATE
jgi:hypothetical protein